MLNGGHASGTLPMQEGPVGQKAPDDYQQPTYTNSCFLDDILASMPNQVRTFSHSFIAQLLLILLQMFLW
jgi:hypothetical protein